MLHSLLSYPPFASLLLPCPLDKAKKKPIQLYIPKHPLLHSSLTRENHKTMPNLASWTREEEKAFENAIAVHSISEPDEENCDKIAYVVPSKSIEEIKLHFEALVEDVGAIEAGKIALPNYGNEESLSTSFSKEQRANSNQGNGNSGFGHSSMGTGNKGSSKLDQERKKGIPWTEEEHRLFLLGLDKFGKGDWRSISRNFVITRTPTQVASHAQKYFIRLNSMNRDRRRSSIHDITTVNGGNVPANQTTITGHQNSNTTIPAVGGVLANKNRITQHNVGPGLGMYGTHIGHPVSSAVGTPVMGHRHPLYAVPNAYPMAPPPMHR